MCIATNTNLHKLYEKLTDILANSVINGSRFELSRGLFKSPIKQINIVGECQTKRIAVSEELSAVSEELDVDSDAKEEYQSNVFPRTWIKGKNGYLVYHLKESFMNQQRFVAYTLNP